MYLLLYGLIIAEPLEHPQINTQSFRPAIDSKHFLWVNETDLGACHSWHGKGVTSQTSNPFLFVGNDGSSTKILSSLSQLDLAGGFTFCQSRLGLNIPFILRAVGELPSGEELLESGIGDIFLDFTHRFSQPEDDIGIAISLRGSAPTTTGRASVQTDGSLIEAEINLDTTINTSVIAVNFGHKKQPSWRDEKSFLGSQIYIRGGFAIPLPKESGVATEVYSSLMYEAENLQQGLLGEIMLSGWKKIAGFTLRAGIGYGLGQAIGRSDLRGLIGMGYRSPARASDSDRDGIVDANDACPQAAEDIDGFQDNDGCSEPTQVSVLILNEDGTPIEEQTWNIGEIQGKGNTPVDIPSQTTILSAQIEGYEPIEQRVTIHGRAKQTLIIPAITSKGTLQLTARDQEGNRIPNAQWSIVGQEKTFSTNQVANLPVRDITIRVIAEGYKVTTKTVQIQANERTAQNISMMPTKAQVKEGKINFDGVILFRRGSAIIDEVSYPLLRDIGDVLKDFPEIEQIRVEGHTDSDGNAKKNKRLSLQRAQAVRSFLISYGIDAQRMVAQGFGEERPVDTNNTQEGKQKNRRVEFYISTPQIK
jgi:outer membrane protein OmpA-like peptidoglycan-associated protein